jgi:hypothetical protein
LRSATVISTWFAPKPLLYSTDYEDATGLAMTRRQFDLGLVRNSSIAEAGRGWPRPAQRIRRFGARQLCSGDRQGPDTVAMPDGLPASQRTQIRSSRPPRQSHPRRRHLRGKPRESVDVASGQKLPNSGCRQRSIRTPPAYWNLSMQLYNGIRPAGTHRRTSSANVVQR